MRSRANSPSSLHLPALIFYTSLPLPASSHVNCFSVLTADLYSMQAPFTQHFHYASCVMMHNMNYVDCFNIWPQEERLQEAAVNATQESIIFLQHIKITFMISWNDLMKFHIFEWNLFWGKFFLLKRWKRKKRVKEEERGNKLKGVWRVKQVKRWGRRRRRKRGKCKSKMWYC